MNVVPDWISHVRQDNFYDFNWSSGDSSTKVLTRGLLNTIDYWLPVGRLITNADGDKMGILRTALPALGSIGMDRLVAGRWVTPNENHIEKLIGDNTDRRPSGGTNHDFCQVAGSRIPIIEQFDSAHFYSYDATSVMDKVWNFSGSHGDVRNTSPPCRCVNSVRVNGGAPSFLEKREYMFNFIYNFTRIPDPKADLPKQ